MYSLHAQYIGENNSEQIVILHARQNLDFTGFTCEQY